MLLLRQAMAVTAVALATVLASGATATAARPAAGVPYPAATPSITFGSTPVLYVQRQSLGSERATSLTVGQSIGSTSSTASIALAVPAGYAIAERPAGTPIGSAGFFYIGDENADSTFASGTIRVSDPSTLAGDPAAQACDPGNHLAVWTVELSTASGQPPPVTPVFVDAPTASDPAGTAYRIQLCPPPPAAGTLLLAMTIAIDGAILVEPSAAADYIWRAYVTPFAAATTDPDPGHAFEVRAELPLPQDLTFQARYDPQSHSAVLTGKLTELGKPKRGAEITFAASSTHVSAQFGPVKTNAAGTFTTRWPVSERTDFQASPEQPSPRPCSGASTAPAGCMSTTVSSAADASARVRVPLRTDPKKAANRADRALAGRINLRSGDLPPDWTARAISPDDEAVCTDFHPDESRLTLTGASYSPVFLTETDESSTQGAFSVVKVWQTEAQARAAFDREARVGQIQCVVDELKGETDLTVVSAGALPLPRLGEASRAFRVALKESGEEQVYNLDVVLFRVRRTLVRMTFAAYGPPPLELPFAQIVAARAKHG